MQESRRKPLLVGIQKGKGFRLDGISEAHRDYQFGVGGGEIAVEGGEIAAAAVVELPPAGEEGIELFLKGWYLGGVEGEAVVSTE